MLGQKLVKCSYAMGQPGTRLEEDEGRCKTEGSLFSVWTSIGAFASGRTGVPKDCCGLQAVVDPREARPEASEHPDAMCQIGTRTW